MRNLKPLQIRNSKSIKIGIILFLFVVNSLSAQKYSVVRNLYFNNQPVQSVSLSVFPPTGGTPAFQLKINSRLYSGTKLVIPYGVLVELQSPSGSIQQIRPTVQGKSVEYKVDFSEKGENHAIKGYGGQIINNVTKAVGYNYRNTNEKGTTAASKGTVFTFTDYSQSKTKEQAIITTKEGTIHIVDEIPVYVNGKALVRHGNPTTKSVSVTQSAGQAQFVSSNNGVNYPNLEYAINSLLREIEKEEDPEELADDYMCLGDLYMDLNKPREAIKSYQEAVDLYEEELGDDDLDTIDAKLSLADAYFETNNRAMGNQLASSCIKILQTMLKEDEAEMSYLNQIRDQNGMYNTCSEMIEICEYLADAFDLIGNTANSQYYTNKANSLCR